MNQSKFRGSLFGLAAGDAFGTTLEFIHPGQYEFTTDMVDNGSLMRLAPVPLFFAIDPEQAIFNAGESSRTTHGAQECIDAPRRAPLDVPLFRLAEPRSLQDRPKDELLSTMFSPVEGLWEREPLAPKIAEFASGSFRRKEALAI